MSESRSVADTAEAAAEICFWPVAEDRIVHPRVGSLGLTGHGSGAIATAACGPFGDIVVDFEICFVPQATLAVRPQL